MIPMRVGTRRSGASRRSGETSQSVWLWIAVAAAAVVVAAAPAASAAAISPPRPDPLKVAAAGAKRVYYEVRMPRGRPRGVVLAFHAGGWCGASPPGGRGCGPPENRVRDDTSTGRFSRRAGGRIFTEIQRTAADHGYVTLGATYTTDEPSLEDVVAFYDQARARWPGLPIYAWGSSAGAHLALVLGALRPLNAVVGEGTPADFEVWKRSLAGAFWVRQALPAIFGARGDPAPNLLNYDPARLYPTPTRTPVMLIAGKRVAGEETDPVVGEAPSQAFARRNRGLTELRLLRPGGYWTTHAKVRHRDLLRARAATLAFLRAHAGGYEPRPARELRQVPGLISIPAAVALARTPRAAPATLTLCDDAPAGSGLAGVGQLTTSPGRLSRGRTAIDVSENACAPTSPRPPVVYGAVHTSVTDGLDLRVVPGPAGAQVPRGTRATATLDAAGATITSYSAVFAGQRTDPGYEMRLAATTADHSVEVLAECGAWAACSGSADPALFAAPGSAAGPDGPLARQSFLLPSGTVKLTWSLTCRAKRCSRAATGDPTYRGLAATLNVYGSTATLSRAPARPPG